MKGDGMGSGSNNGGGQSSSNHFNRDRKAGTGIIHCGQDSHELLKSR